MAETEMVERVAKAICDELNGDHGCGGFCVAVAKYGAAARAAIEAMRSPTPAMQAAIPPQEYTVEHFYGTGHHLRSPTLGSGPLSIWQSMIDAALTPADKE
jgi:hypothetical protein